MSGSRPIRVLLAILGLDQHEAGAFTVARILRDAGMEVIYLGRFAVPETVVRAAADENADIIGLSCHSWEYLHYLDELLERLRQEGLEIPVVVGGSVITRADQRELAAKGVAAAFGAGAGAEEMVARLRDLAAGTRDASRGQK